MKPSKQNSNPKNDLGLLYLPFNKYCYFLIWLKVTFVAVAEAAAMAEATAMTPTAAMAETTTMTPATALTPAAAVAETTAMTPATGMSTSLNILPFLSG
ncbi:hypothetical protein JMG10_37935 [Nostoc ellipsosporum NOK]|nr:hypothetical protein [Nostoc ellipsosporum NOK]